MDVNDLRAALTVVMFLLFLGIVIWAYSRRNSERFAEAARLPLDDDFAGEDYPTHAGARQK